MKFKFVISLATLLLCSTLVAVGLTGQTAEECIERAIANYVKDHSAWKENQIELGRVAGIPNPGLLDGSLRYEARAMPRANLFGRTDFTIDVLKEGEKIDSFRVTTRVAIWMDVLLASHPMKGGEIIHDTDVYVGKRNLEELPTTYLMNLEEVVGMKVKYYVGANALITRDNVKESPMFQKGDRVYILAESESLKITALGVAKDEGYKGKSVRVMNLQSKKEISGEVAEDGSIHVLF